MYYFTVCFCDKNSTKRIFLLIFTQLMFFYIMIYIYYTYIFNQNSVLLFTNLLINLYNNYY